MFYSFTSIEVTNGTYVFVTLQALVARLLRSSCRILSIIVANWTG